MVDLTPKRKKDFEILRGSYEKSSRHKKWNKSLVCRTHPLATLSNRPLSIIDKRLCNYVALIQNNVIRMENDVTANACPTDYCGFPYYRSCRTNYSIHDNVLMKDVAVSCTLLEPKANQDNLTLSAIENYFLKQLKNEYQDVSVITKKIRTYIKDKFHNLSVEYKKRQSYFKNLEKRPVATEYIDKNGNICLKLRLKDLQSNGIKEEKIIKNIVSTFANSWNFLSSLQQRKENVRGETRNIFVKSPRQSCFCVHKGKYRKDKRISRSNEKTLETEITPKFDAASHIYAQNHNKYQYNHKMRPPNTIIKRDK